MTIGNEKSHDSLSSNPTFSMFMDNVSKAGKSNRNKIINEWLALLDHDAQIRLINKLKARGIEYIPNENQRFYEV